MESVPDSEILLYTSPDGEVQLDIRMQQDTMWMTQQMMAELFQTTVQNIIMHVRNIYKESELQREGTCKDFLQVRKEGSRTVRRPVNFYNLDMLETRKMPLSCTKHHFCTTNSFVLHPRKTNLFVLHET